MVTLDRAVTALVGAVTTWVASDGSLTVEDFRDDVTHRSTQRVEDGLAPARSSALTAQVMRRTGYTGLFIGTGGAAGALLRARWPD